MLDIRSIYYNPQIPTGYYYAKVIDVQTESMEGYVMPKVLVRLKLHSNHGLGDVILSAIVYPSSTIHSCLRTARPPVTIFESHCHLLTSSTGPSDFGQTYSICPKLFPAFLAGRKNHLCLLDSGDLFIVSRPDRR